MVDTWLFLVCKNAIKINLKACNFKIFPGACSQTLIALACFVQHNKHKSFLNQILAGYVPDSTKNKFWPPHYKISSYAYDNWCLLTLLPSIQNSRRSSFLYYPNLPIISLTKVSSLMVNDDDPIWLCEEYVTYNSWAKFPTSLLLW